MNIEEYFIMMLPGVVTYFAIIWISFADLAGILLKILPSEKVLREYDEMKKVTNSSQFKIHKRKWTKVYLLFLFAYVISYTLIAISIKSCNEASLVAFVISIFCFAIAKNIEGKQRRSIEKQVRKCEVK